MQRQVSLLAETTAEIVPRPDGLPRGADLVIDGLVGYRLTGPLRGRARDLVELAKAQHGGPVVALDVPSGLHPDRGGSEGVSIHADGTMTVGLPKRGLLDPTAGDLWLADIGLPSGLFTELHLPSPPIEVARAGLVPLTRT